MTSTDIPQIIKDMQTFLQSKGHPCVTYHSLEDRLTWCQKDPCEDIKRRERTLAYHKKQQELAADLIIKGHNCVLYLNTYPIEIQWCDQNMCIGKKRDLPMK